MKIQKTAFQKDPLFNPEITRERAKALSSERQAIFLSLMAITDRLELKNEHGKVIPLGYLNEHGLFEISAKAVQMILSMEKRNFIVDDIQTLVARLNQGLFTYRYGQLHIPHAHRVVDHQTNSFLDRLLTLDPKNSNLTDSAKTIFNLVKIAQEYLKNIQILDKKEALKFYEIESKVCDETGFIYSLTQAILLTFLEAEKLKDPQEKEQLLAKQAKTILRYKEMLKLELSNLEVDFKEKIKQSLLFMPLVCYFNALEFKDFNEIILQSMKVSRITENPSVLTMQLCQSLFENDVSQIKANTPGGSICFPYLYDFINNLAPQEIVKYLEKEVKLKPGVYDLLDQLFPENTESKEEAKLKEQV